MPDNPSRRLIERLLGEFLDPPRVHTVIEQLFNSFGTLPAALESIESNDQLQLPEDVYMLLSMVPELYEYLVREQMPERPLLNTLRHAGRYAAAQYVNTPYERVLLLCLDEEYCLIEPIFVGEGELFEVAFYPRRLMQLIFQARAHAAILCHNHPGGWRFFSDADVSATQELLTLCAQIQLPLIDHLLVCGGHVASMRIRAHIPDSEWMRCGPKSIPLHRWRLGLGASKEYFTDSLLNL